MLQASPLSPERSTFVEIASNCATILFERIDDLLDLSKVEAGQVELAHGAFSPKETLERSVKRLQPRAGTKVTVSRANPHFPFDV